MSSKASALCCTRGACDMNGDAASSRRPSVTVRLTPDEKRRFATIAAARGQSESELGLAAVRMLLDLSSNQLPSNPSLTPKESASDRITIRLRPGDRHTIAERARLRGTKASTYIAALVRAHVASNPPLTADELTALKAGGRGSGWIRSPPCNARQRPRRARRRGARSAARTQSHSRPGRRGRATAARIRACVAG